MFFFYSDDFQMISKRSRQIPGNVFCRRWIKHQAGGPILRECVNVKAYSQFPARTSSRTHRNTERKSMSERSAHKGLCSTCWASPLILTGSSFTCSGFFQFPFLLPWTPAGPGLTYKGHDVTLCSHRSDRINRVSKQSLFWAP